MREKVTECVRAVMHKHADIEASNHGYYVAGSRISLDSVAYAVGVKRWKRSSQIFLQ